MWTVSPALAKLEDRADLGVAKRGNEDDFYDAGSDASGESVGVSGRNGDRSVAIRCAHFQGHNEDEERLAVRSEVLLQRRSGEHDRKVDLEHPESDKSEQKVVDVLGPTYKGRLGLLDHRLQEQTAHLRAKVQ